MLDYLRDDKPFGGAGPPAHFSILTRSQRRTPQDIWWICGILQAGRYDGYGKLYLAGRAPGPITEPLWVHARRPFFAMADIEQNARRKAASKKEIRVPSRSRSYVASIRCSRSSDPSMVRAPRSAWPFDECRAGLSVEALEVYMRAQLDRLARGHDLAKAIITCSSAGGPFTCSR